MKLPRSDKTVAFKNIDYSANPYDLTDEEAEEMLSLMLDVLSNAIVSMARKEEERWDSLREQRRHWTSPAGSES